MLKSTSYCNTIILQKVQSMSIQIKSDRKKTENKTVQFPVDMLTRIDTIMREYDVSFTGFVLQACEYVLDELEKDQPS